MICISCKLEKENIAYGKRSCNTCCYNKRKEKQVQSKVCNRCNKETLNYRPGVNICRECEAIKRKERYHKDIEQSRNKAKEYSAKNKEKIIERKDKLRGGLKISLRKIIDGQMVLIKLCSLCKSEKVKIKETDKRWSCINPECNCKRKKFEYETKPSYKLKQSLSVRLRQLITNKKKGDTVKYLGCSIPYVKKWLEYNFEDGMTWENYGTKWHIDHIKPCNSYNFENIEEIEDCFNWKNIRPCFAVENLRKSNKLIPELITNYRTISNYFINIIQQKENILNEIKSKASLTTANL